MVSIEFMKHVFISYSRTDAKMAELIAKACDQCGVTFFKDDRSLEFGTDWHDDIVEAVSISDLFLLLVSDASLKSRVVNQELGMARMVGTVVVPVLLVAPECLPPEIARLNGVSLVDATPNMITQRVTDVLAATENMRLTLPTALGEKISKEPSYSAFFASIPAAINAPAFNTSGHGAAHIQNLLSLVDWLLSEESRKKLTQGDIVILTAALVLRERLWFMPQTALSQLLSIEPCATQWKLYRAHLRSEGVPVPSCGDTPLAGVFPEIIEEFIHSNIGLLAYESAINSPDEFQLPQAFLSVLSSQRLKWAALIAQADSGSFRHWIDKSIPSISESRLADGCRPVIIAGLLRCAWKLSQYVTRFSDNSSLEPKNYSYGVRELRYDSVTDKQSMEVIAEPHSGTEYEAILKWIDAVQMRLDEVWAVWSQVYGEGHFGLLIRTVNSLLRDELAYVRMHKLPFEPKPARLTTASTKLIRQLCEPLYGARPEVGVRELVQNGIDAVRELDAWSSQVGKSEVLNDADVLVTLFDYGSELQSKARYWLEVQDRGVGMTPETIRHFFLTVGASFRDSPEWLDRYATDHSPVVMRSGRFGVGVIAAFLLSEELHVSTRHVTELDGIGTRFLAKLDDSPVELYREPLPQGTTIRLPLSKSVFELLSTSNPGGNLGQSWDWYCLSVPEVVRLINIAGESEKLVPTLHESMSSFEKMPWRSITVDGLDSCFWRPGESTAHHNLWCNGIRVLREHRTIWSRVGFGESAWSLEEADVVVFDSLGVLPINLARDGLSRDALYSEALRKDILLDHCAWLLYQASLDPTALAEKPPMWSNTYYNRGNGDGVVFGPAYLKTKSGIIPFTLQQVSKASLNSLLVYSGLDSSVDIPEDVVSSVVKVEPYGGFYPESMTSAAVRMLNEFLRSNLSVQELSIFTNAPGDAPNLVEVSGLIGWRRQDADEEIAPWLKDFIESIPSSNTHAFIALVDLDHSTEPKADDLSELVENLGLPPVIPYSDSCDYESCSKALDLLGERVKQYKRAY